MLSLGEKIRQLRKEKDLTQEQFGNILGVVKSTVSQYESDTSTPDIIMLIKIAELFNISLDQLVGRSVLTKSDSVHVSSLITSVPILGRIRAGIPILAAENWEGEVNLSEDLRADFALRVEGDSMSWAGIYDGDLAFFSQADTAMNGDIVAAGAEDGEWYATLKFYIVENGVPVLRAANPNFKDIPITDKHRIIGTLVGIYKEPPSIMDYKKFLISMELNSTGWSEAVEKATQHGLESKQLVQLIELFSHVVKQVK